MVMLRMLILFLLLVIWDGYRSPRGMIRGEHFVDSYPHAKESR